MFVYAASRFWITCTNLTSSDYAKQTEKRARRLVGIKKSMGKKTDRRVIYYAYTNILRNVIGKVRDGVDVDERKL